MHGAINTMAKNVRRVGLPAKRRGKANPVYAKVSDGPTPERLAKSQGFYTVGNETQGAKITTMRDAVLERMYARSAISGPEYAALQKYHHHWHCAGLESCIGSADLGRIFSNDPSSLSGMAKTEAQAHHRQQWRAARALLGHRVGIVVDNVVCAGNSLEVAGFSVGWRSKPQAIAASTEMLRDAGYRLARFWGIG